MSTVTAVTPIKKLTVIVDACVYRSCPDAGDQLAAMMAVLKKKGVECHFLQDRFSLMESTNNYHELILCDDRHKLHQMQFGNTEQAARARKYPPPDYIQNYLSFVDSVQTVVPVTYYDAPGCDAVLNERKALTRQHLFEDERFKQWPEVRRGLIARTIRPDQLNDYNHSLLSTCSLCAHTIEGIHHFMKVDPKLNASIPPETRRAFMLDLFKQGRPVFWEHIDLTAMNPDNIPMPIVDAFGKGRVMQKLFGKHERPLPGHELSRRDHTAGLTPLGKRTMKDQMDLGETIIAREAHTILQADHDPGHVVLLLTDDNKGLARFESLEKEFPNCTSITSREMATLAVAMHNFKGMQKQLPHSAWERARNISCGIIRTQSPSARGAEYIMSGETTFTDRVAATLSNKEARDRT